MTNCLGIINLDENENRMGDLVRNRPLASIPLAARYRVIDFVLSNMTNSGIECIGIFAKNKSRSLMDHLTNGRPWDLHRKKDGLKVFNFSSVEPAYDDVHIFEENIEFIKYSRKEYILLASSAMICNIDYKEVIRFHKESGNDITMVYKNVIDKKDRFQGCGIINFDKSNNILSVGKNIEKEEAVDINMEMYIMGVDLFVDIVRTSVKTGLYKKVKDYIHSCIKEYKIGGYEFDGYLSCINSVKAYYDCNMDLLKHEINKELFYNKPIYTKSKDEAPTHYTNNSKVSNSIIANGCYIEGTVDNCVVFRRVFIDKDAKVSNCIIMQNTVIGSNSLLKNVITDKGVEIKREESLIGSKAWPSVMSNKKYM